MYSLPASITPGSTIRGAAFAFGSIAVITTNGVASANSTALSAFNIATGLPLSTQMTQIRGPMYCDFTISRASTLNQIIITWDSTAVSTVSVSNVSFFVSQDGGTTFTAVSINVDINAVGGGFIRDVAVQHTYNNLAVLIRDGSAYDRIATFNLSSMTVSSTLGYSFNPAVNANIIVDGGSKGSSPKLTPIPGGQLLVWGDMLCYSSNGGANVFSVSLLSRDPSRPAIGLASSEYIKDVTAGYDGRIAVLTSTNRVFYGRAGLSSAIELIAGLTTTQQATILFDSLNRLTVLTPQATPNYLVKRFIATDNQVSSTRVPASANPALICPYSSFSTNISSEIVLDAGDAIYFSSTIVPSSFASSNYISVTLTNRSIVNSSITVHDSVQWTSSGISKVRTANYYLSGLSKAQQGRTDVIVSPKNDSLVCTPSATVAVVRVGCPTSRRMVFRVPSTVTTSIASPTPRFNWDYRFVTATPIGTPTTTAIPSAPTYDCSAAPTSITVPGGSWVSDWSSQAVGTYDKIESYSCSKYGVAVPVFYGNYFVPVFDIFDGDTYVKTTTADIALWEVNNRTTYTFNTTMGEAGCLVKAQSWRSLASQNPTVASNALNLSDYVACYVSSDNSTSISAKELASTYEILNASNYNAVVWTSRQEGYYLFKARVVDPSYSYCTLEAYFAVYVEGAPMFWGVQFGVIIAVVGCGVIGLCLSYRVYALEQKAEREKEMATIAANTFGGLMRKKSKVEPKQKNE